MSLFPLSLLLLQLTPQARCSLLSLGMPVTLALDPTAKPLLTNYA